MNHELPDVQAGFRKGRGTRDQITNIHWIIEKVREFQKTCILLKPLIVWVTTNWNVLKEMGIWDCRTCLLRNPYAGQETTVRTRHGTMDWFKIEKEYVKAVYCNPAYVTYIQSTSCEISGLMNHKLESRLPGEISITLDTQLTPQLRHKEKRN